jgi:hypothetical protein
MLCIDVNVIILFVLLRAGAAVTVDGDNGCGLVREWIKDLASARLFGYSERS